MEAIQLGRAEIEAALEELKPKIKKEARVLCRRLNLPSNVDPEDLIQAGMIGAWQSLQRYDGRGSVGAFAAKRVRGAMIDFLRSWHPAGRNGPEVSFTGLDDISEMASSDDPAKEIEDREHFMSRLNSLSADERGVAEQVLLGAKLQDIAASKSLSPARVSQMAASAAANLADAKGSPNKTPDSFDPDAVIISMGVPVPSSQVKRTNKARELLNRMPATGSVVLANSAARTLVAEMKLAGVRYATFKVSETTTQVWREPSKEQLAARPGRQDLKPIKPRRRV